MNNKEQLNKYIEQHYKNKIVVELDNNTIIEWGEVIETFFKYEYMHLYNYNIIEQFKNYLLNIDINKCKNANGIITTLKEYEEKLKNESEF